MIRVGQHNMKLNTGKLHGMSELLRRDLKKLRSQVGLTTHSKYHSDR